MVDHKTGVGRLPDEAVNTLHEAARIIKRKS
jgi:hypothetical protein